MKVELHGVFAYLAGAGCILVAVAVALAIISTFGWRPAGLVTAAYVFFFGAALAMLSFVCALGIWVIHRA